MGRESGERRRTKKGLDSELSSNSRGDFSRFSIVKAVDEACNCSSDTALP
jgi:hypothetical protein